MTQEKRGIVKMLGDAQPAIVELFTLLSPYAAAALPAALSGGNIANYIMADSGVLGTVVGVLSGIGLEMIGMAVGWVLVTTIQKTAGLPFRKNWRLQGAIYAGVHYIAANLAANVGIVMFGNTDITRGLATAALSTMSVPAVVVAVLRALEVSSGKDDEKRKEDSKEAMATSFAQGMERMKQQNEHEEAQLRIQAEKEITLARIARGLDPDAPQPAAPVAKPPVQAPLIPEIDPQARAIIDDMTAQGKSKRAMARALWEQTRLTKSQIASALGVHASLVTQATQGISRS